MSWPLVALGQGVRRMWGLRWVFGVPIATLLAGSTLYAIRLPETYESRAVVRVKEVTGGERSALPEERASTAHATVATTVDRLFAVPHLRAVAAILAPGADPDDARVLELVRRNLALDRQSEYSFAVRASSIDAARASKAVNRLLESFLEAERRGPLRRAESTRDFRAHKLTEAIAPYTKAVAALAAFDLANAETLPQRREGLNIEIQSLKNEMDMRRQISQSAKSRIDFLGQQLSLQDVRKDDPKTALPRAEETRLLEKIRAQETAKTDAERQLSVALARYTEKHPTIIAIQKTITALEEDLKATRLAVTALHETQQAEPAPTEERRESDAVKLMRVMRQEAEQELARAVSDLESLKEQQAPLVQKVSAIPQTEALRKPLEKAVTDAEPRRAVAQKSLDEAEVLAEYLRSSDASDVTAYKVEQWGATPVEASGPGRGRIVMTCMGIGVALGYGLFLLRRKFHRGAVLTPDDLREFAREAMVVSVPLLPSGGKSRRRLRLPLGEMALGAWVLLCLGVTALAMSAHARWIALPPWLHDLMGIRA